MIELPAKPMGLIPDKLKKQNGYFFGQAVSDDPAIKCQNIVNLVQNIRTTMFFAKMLDFEIIDEQFGMKTTLGKFLDYQLKGAYISLAHYTSGNIGQAVGAADGVLAAIGIIVYNEEYVSQTDAHAWKRGDK